MNATDPLLFAATCIISVRMALESLPSVMSIAGTGHELTIAMLRALASAANA
jgi:hypothetical protein